MERGSDTGDEADGCFDSLEKDPFTAQKALGRSPKKDAFDALMNRAKEFSGREKSASLSDLTSGRTETPTRLRPELPSEKTNANRDKTGEKPLLDTIKADLLTLDRLIQEQQSVKREIKAGIKDIIRQFDLVIKNHANCGSEKKKISAYEKQVLEFRKRIMATGGDKGKIDKLVSEKWPPGAFVNTRVSPKNNGNDESAINSIIVIPENYTKDKHFASLALKYPGMKHITVENLKNLGQIVIEKEESTFIPGIDSTLNRKTVHIIKAALVSDKGKLETADVMNWVECLKKHSKETGKQKAVVSIPEDSDLENIRKIMELCLFEPGLTVWIKPNKKDRRTNYLKKKNESIIVSGDENKSFADILKDVKANINPTEFGVEIKKIGATKSGELRLTIKEKIKGGNEEMLKNIRERVSTAKTARITKNYKSFVLLDIEDDIESSEVKEELMKQLGVKEMDVKIYDFRRSSRGTKMVTVSLPKEFADRAVELKRIKIGWTMCTVKEKIDPKLCPKCQCYGHMEKDCKGEVQKQKRCLNCGEFGHQSMVCKEEENCFSCQIKGHRANSMACPFFRGLVHEMKRKAKNV